MGRNRRTVGIDAELIDQLKNIAVRRGVTLVNYLRALIKEAIRIEELGHYAPRALKERYLESLLEGAGFMLIPKDALREVDENVATDIGYKAGLLLKEMGIDIIEVIELLSKYAGNTITDSSKLIVMSSLNDPASAVISIIKGLSKAAGLNIISHEPSMIIVNLPQETYSKALNEFERHGRKRQ